MEYFENIFIHIRRDFDEEFRSKIVSGVTSVTSRISTGVSD